MEGSGKSGTPFSRMHWANLRRAAICWLVKVVGMNPAGSSSVHALMACFQAAVLGSNDEPALIPYMNWPDASGSGNSLTPLSRMHSANFTAFSTLVAVLAPPLLPEPVATGAFGPHALTMATMAIRVRAAVGRSLLLIPARSPRAPMIEAMTTAIARKTVDREGLLAVLVRCRSRSHSRQRDVARTYTFFDTPAISPGAYHCESVRVLIVEDEPYMAEAIRDGLRLEAIAADIAADGNTALELLDINTYDIAVLDRDIPGPSGDEVAERIVASGSGMPILMLTAADRLDDKASGFGLGADDYLTKPFELRELVLRLRALDRRRAHNRPPVREIAGLRLDPFRREVYRDGRYVALTRKQFAVLEVLVAAEGGVISAEELLERAWDENADPFTNAVRITVSALRKRLGEPWVIATVAGAGYRISTDPGTGLEGADRG